MFVLFVSIRYFYIMVSEPPEEKESNSQPIITSVNDQLKSVIKQHLTDCDLTSIPVLTPYEITKYDGLFLDF